MQGLRETARQKIAVRRASILREWEGSQGPDHLIEFESPEKLLEWLSHAGKEA